ncbi:hypothetical protein C0992_003361 [Termitomyces sp. T32_za158]|nr:hypothetical protein C0992_003361 [Termitomyces sp. T32_za158]
MQKDAKEDVLVHKSHFLSVSARKSPSRPTMKNRKSTSSLRGLGIPDDAANGRHSLAHELAVALMPEPSTGSRLLAEEFGIDYDERVEGVDEQPESGVQIVIGGDPDSSSFAEELGPNSFGSEISQDDFDQPSHVPDPVFGVPSTSRSHSKERPQQDAMELLAQNLESTDKFLSHLRTLDIDPGPYGSQPPALERIASDVIRRINETTRDREGQVRELLEYEREFRKISGEVGGAEVLGSLEELSSIHDLSEDKQSSTSQPEFQHTLEVLEDETPSLTHRRHKSLSQDWETNPDRLGDEEDDYEVIASPTKDSFPPPPPINGDTTPAKTVPQLAHLRSFTASLVSSLSTISEQAQVNGAATTEAGRKIRALKNKLGGWRADWDNAEKSRMKIDRWEAGIMEGDELDRTDAPPIPTLVMPKRRLDGRKVVEEHLRAFECALADAAVKTQAIMAAS